MSRANFNGVSALKDKPVPTDAPVVSNLKNAGAIIIGLTNTPKFSMGGFTYNPAYGLTLNPWDNAITCGGSSGGLAQQLRSASALSRTAMTRAARCDGRRVAAAS